MIFMTDANGNLVNIANDNQGNIISGVTNVTQDILWENSSPASRFTEVTLTIENLENYNIIYILANSSNYQGNNNPISTQMSMVNYIGSVNSILYDGYDRSRKVEITSNNTIKFYRDSIADSNYDCLIPIKIYGIKFSASNSTGWVDGQDTIITETQVTTETNIDMSQFITNYDENGEYEALLEYTIFNTSNGEFYLGSDKITLVKVAEAGRENVSNYTNQTINIPFTKYFKYKLSSTKLNSFQISLLGYRRIK